MKIRTAQLSDLDQITKIFNEAIKWGSATAFREPFTPDSRTDWFWKHQTGIYKIFVSEEDGYTNFNKTNTKSFFKFKDILDIYRNNGNTFSNTGRVIKKGSIVVFFDPGTYLGYFESFNWVEDANNPFRFTFDFTFKVKQSFTGI